MSLEAHTERERRIREVVTRAADPKSNVSPEFNLLSVEDAKLLLDELDQARDVGSAFHQVARDMASLVVSKQQSYGDSFGKSGDVLRSLYPHGIPPDGLTDALTVVRVVDKLFRVAHHKHAFGESPWRDILGYALLAVERDERVKP